LATPWVTELLETQSVGRSVLLLVPLSATHSVIPSAKTSGIQSVTLSVNNLVTQSASNRKIMSSSTTAPQLVARGPTAHARR
jgi:hypothetical protein